METSGFRFAVVWGVALTAQLAACAGASPDEPPIPPGPEAVAGWRMVDLSHAYGASTLYWPTDTTGFQLDTLHFPGIGAAAARLLVEDRRAALLGIDTASVDRGQSTDFIGAAAARSPGRRRGRRPHRPPGRRRGRRPQPGERRGPLRTAADRVPARRAADED